MSHRTMFVMTVLLTTGCNDSKPTIADAAGDRGAAPEARVDGRPLNVDGRPLDATAGKGWALSLAGAGPDNMAARVDKANNIVVTGSFAGTASLGTVTLTAKGTAALFVAKLDPSGKVLSVITVDTTEVSSGDIAIDSEGNLYLAMTYSGTVSIGSETLATSQGGAGDRDILIIKLDPTGKKIWAKTAAGAGTATANGRSTAMQRVALDSAGNLTVVGEFLGTLTFGGTSLTAKGHSDGFVTRVDPSGTFLRAQQVGSDALAGEGVYGVAVDSSGNTTIGAMISGAASFGAVNLTAKKNFEIAVAKLDATGTFLWAKAAHSTTAYICGWTPPAVVLDGAGNFYLAGGVFYDGAGPERPFVAKYDSSGQQTWKWDSAGTGQSGVMQLNGVIDLLVDATGAVTALGNFIGTKQMGSQLLSASGGQDLFIVGVEPSGTATWAKQLGGAGKDYGWTIARDTSGDLYVAGMFEQSLTLGGMTLTSKGDYDGFVWKVNGPKP